MAQENPISRRTAMKLTGAAAATALVAGCGDDDDNGNGNGNGNGEFNIAPDETIELDGYSSHWEGVAPGDIEGEENPTLVLEEGEDYTIEWINADGITHDLQIWDDGGDALEETDSVDDEGDSETLEFEATSDMVEYICTFHQQQQVGDLVVE